PVAPAPVAEPAAAIVAPAPKAVVAMNVPIVVKHSAPPPLAKLPAVASPVADAPVPPLAKMPAKIVPPAGPAPGVAPAASPAAYAAALGQCRTFMTAGKIKRAVDSCRLATEADPRGAEALTLLAEAEWTRGHSGVALKLATDATNAVPGYADAYVI